MPYIKQDDRHEYDEFLNAHIQDLEENCYPVGDVTYAIYKIVGCMFKHDERYQTIAEIRGLLAGVLSEFDRRLAFPYEDKKIKENGDVDLDLPLPEVVEHDVCICNGGFRGCDDCNGGDTRGGA